MKKLKRRECLRTEGTARVKLYVEERRVSRKREEEEEEGQWPILSYSFLCVVAWL